MWPEKGAQQTDVALGVVVHRPVQVLDRDHVEEPEASISSL
jgi:hypothetical protein